MTDPTDLYRLLEQLDEEGLDNARNLVHDRLARIKSGAELVRGVEYTDAQKYDSRVALLRPFLADIWDDAFDDFYEQLSQGYNPGNRNPFRDDS